MPAKVTIDGPGTMTISQVVADSPYLSTEVNLNADTPDKREWTLDILRSAATPVGNFNGKITITTNQPKYSTIVIPVSGAVGGELEATPSTCFFGFLKPGTHKELPVTIRDLKGRPFSIRQYSLEGEKTHGLSVRTLTPGSLAEHKLVVDLQSDKTGGLHATLMVETDISGEENVPIQIAGMISQVP